jgi:hypothetical protein
LYEIIEEKVNAMHIIFALFAIGILGFKWGILA